MSRYGARNGAPSDRFGMKGRNDSAIRRSRTAAKQRGHKLKPGIVTSDNDGVEVYSASCRCGRVVIVRDGDSWPGGTACAESCDAP